MQLILTCIAILSNILIAYPITWTYLNNENDNNNLPPNCKIIILSTTNGAEVPLTNITYTIALVNNTNNHINATKNITVNYNLTQPYYMGSAVTPNADYTTPTTQSIIIQSGRSIANIRINVIDDNNQENPEQLTLELISTNDTNYPISTITTEKIANAYIIDNDKNDPNIIFSKNNYKINVKIPAENAKGTLPSCYTTISFANIPNLLPTATHNTEGTLTVTPAYNPLELLKANNTSTNSAGTYNMKFYARNNQTQKTGQFTLEVTFTDPLSLATVQPLHVHNDQDCTTTYTLPVPSIQNNPNCNRQIKVSNLTFDRLSEITEIDAINRVYKFPYGNTIVSYTAKEYIDGCTNCTSTVPEVNIKYTFKRNNTGDPTINPLPNIILAIDPNTCKAIIDPTLIASYQGTIGCQNVQLTKDPTSKTEFNTSGEYEIIYTLTNNYNGKTARTVQKVFVNSSAKPEVTLINNNFIVNTPKGSCTYNFQSNDIATAFKISNNCSNSTQNVKYSITQNQTLKIGTHQIMIWLVDDSGNASQKKQLQLQVQPTDFETVPEFKQQNINVTLEPNQTTVNIDWEEPIVSNCFINITPTKSHQPNQSFQQGAYTVTYTYNFNNRNTITRTFTITINQTGTEALLNQIKVYKAITPNNDGKNDYWHIDNINLFPNNQVKIYNDLGKLVWNITGYNNQNNSWKGYNSLVNSELPQGTYYYHITITNPNHELKGSILLFR